MVLSGFVSRAAAVLVLCLSGLFLFQLVDSASWRVPAEVSRMPCTLRPGATLEFFVTVSHPGLVGFALEYLPQRNTPPMRLALSTVPGDTVVASTALRPRGSELWGRFPPVHLAPRALLKARLTMDARGEPVMLNCRPLAQPGPPQERPVAHTYHRLGRTAPMAFGAWMHARVTPLLPPGARRWAVGLMIAAPLLMAATVWVIARSTHGRSHA